MRLEQPATSGLRALLSDIEAGRVRVEDAHGAAPSIPFWNGEAPGRTFELSEEVAKLRTEKPRTDMS